MKFLLTVSLFFFVSAAEIPAYADAPANPDAATFISVAVEHYAQLKTQTPPPFIYPGLNVPVHIPIVYLIRGQEEISVDNIYAKLTEHQDQKNLEWKHGNWQLNHNGGKSVVPRTDAISVVKGPMGYVVVDGHHDLYLSLYVGAETIAVNVTQDLSHLSAEEFWATLKQEKKVLLKESARKLAENPPDMEVIHDNPNRYLATLLAAKVKADFEKGHLKITKVKGGKHALWVKLNNGVPFVEFYIAAILSSVNIEYDPSWGIHVPGLVVEQARKALLNPKGPYAKEIKNIPIFSLAQSESGILKDEKALGRFLERLTGTGFAGACIGEIFE